VKLVYYFFRIVSEKTGDYTKEAPFPCFFPEREPAYSCLIPYILAE